MLTPLIQIWIHPDCGLKTRKEEETIASLQNMVKATKYIRNQKAVNQGINSNGGVSNMVEIQKTEDS